MRFERVISLKVKSPRSKSLTSHFIKSLIQKRRGMIQGSGYTAAAGSDSRPRCAPVAATSRTSHATA